MGDRLRAAGVAVFRINLCPGDAVAWGLAPSVTYRGRKDDWPAYVGDFMERHGIEALVLHSERRPYHLEAAAEARRRGIDLIATELGYIRPDFMTIERNGNSVDSLVPADPDAIRAIARDVPPPEPGIQFPRQRLLETFDDLKNNLPNVFLWFLTPHYRAHGLYHPFVAYARFLRREARAGLRQRAAQAVRERLRSPFFMFAMQTDTDFQIRSNSQFSDMREALTVTLASFAVHAPPETRLVVRKHPGDLGPVHWAAELPRLARAAGVPDRVDFVDGLLLPEWLRDAAGLVTANSTAGLDALVAGVPTHALSPAIYDVPGMTDQGRLDDFWSTTPRPDTALVGDFLTALAGSVQVRGTIFSRQGTRAAADAMAARILAGTVGVPGPPPRHARARALGIR